MGNAESAAQAYMDSLVDSTNAMADSVGKMTGFATQKVYHLKLDGRRLIVVLRHDLSGARRLFVNSAMRALMRMCSLRSKLRWAASADRGTVAWPPGLVASRRQAGQHPVR